MQKQTGSRQMLLLPGWPALRVATKQDSHWTSQTWDQDQLQLTDLAEVSACKEAGGWGWNSVAYGELRALFWPTAAI